ncbi:MAG: tetratricopeptide repeat protein [Anaerolineae bacterium]
MKAKLLLTSAVMALLLVIGGNAKLNSAQASVKDAFLRNSCLSKAESSIAFASSISAPSLGVAMGLGSRRPEASSPEVQMFITDTYLAHTEEYPDPNEPVEVLRLYLEGQELLRYRRIGDAIALFEQAIQRFPESRHAHAGLGYAMWQRYKDSGAEEDLRLAIDEFLRAARIGMKFGKVRYTYQIAVGLAQLGDRGSMDQLFREALDVGDRKYLTSLDYARGLGLLGDPRAEAWYKKAIELQPEGNVDAIAYYAEWLLDQGQEERVLQIIPPDEHIEYLHFLKGVALERLGRMPEARGEYLQYIEASALDAAPSRYRISGSKVQEGIVFDDQIAPRGIGCQGYELLANVIECEAGGESEGGKRAVGWTVRTRVFMGTLPGCVYVNNNSCGNFLTCKYECVITQAYQFVYNCGRSPGPTSRHVRYDVYNGYAPDPTMGYCPSGSYQGDACSASVHCSSGGANGASNQGPMRFYSTTGSCPTGGEYSCLTSKGKVCGDGGSDHCFYNRP